MSLTSAFQEGISVKPRRTLTIVATRQILTDRVKSTSRFVSILRTLVYVSTLPVVLVSNVSLDADADVASVIVRNALLANRTGLARGACWRVVASETARTVGVSRGSSGTLAGEASGFVLTDRACWAAVYGALVDVDAAQVGPGVARAADAPGFLVDQHALLIWLTVH